MVLLEGEAPPRSQGSADWNRFSSRVTLYLAPSVLPSTLISFPVPEEVKLPYNSMLPPPWFTLGMVFSNKHSTLCYNQKFQFMSHQTWQPSCIFAEYPAFGKHQTWVLMIQSNKPSSAECPSCGTSMYTFLCVSFRAPRWTESISTAWIDPPFHKVQGRHSSRLFSVLAPGWTFLDHNSWATISLEASTYTCT